MDKQLPSVNFLAGDGSNHAIHDMVFPQSIYENGKTFITYMGNNNSPSITAYDHISQCWEDIIIPVENPLGGSNPHGAPALTLTKDGRICLFYGSHGSPQKFIRSRNPYDIYDWEMMPDLLPHVTYPYPFRLKDGTLILFGRKGLYQSPWFETVSNDDGNTWSSPRDIINFLPLGLFASFIVGPDGQTVHCTFTHDDTRFQYEWQNRRHCFYAKRDLEGQWTNAAEEILIHPINTEMAFNQCLILRTNPMKSSNVGSIGVGKENSPYIVFIEGLIEEMDFSLQFARWKGDNWDIREITRTDNIFDNKCAIFYRTNGQIDVFLIAGGTDKTYFKRGGNIQLWKSTDDGETWKKDKDIITYEETEQVYTDIQPVLNGRFDAEIVFCDWHHADPIPGVKPTQEDRAFRPNDYTHRIYLYGELGFIKRDSANKWLK